MKICVIILAVIFLSACKGGAGKTKASDTAKSTTDIVDKSGGTMDSTMAPGAKLIAMNDCLTCHKINETYVGPSYIQVANKYDLNQGNIENLAHRIIKGGTGLWGSNKMTPHSLLTDQQAEAMARYILSLRDTTSLK